MIRSYVFPGQKDANANAKKRDDAANIMSQFYGFVNNNNGFWIY
jgi:hypothetical protein